MQKAQEQADAQSKEVGETCMLLAMAHGAVQGQREQAKALYERAAAVFSAALGPGHAQTLEAQKMVGREDERREVLNRVRRAPAHLRNGDFE
eukprot:COSAG04_NODE_1566_length_6320_cov_15.884102_10_plen_92_part_00